MPRNASAIALKIYTLVVVAAMTIGIFPKPIPLQITHPLYQYATLILISGGCFISLVGICWPRAHNRKDARKRVDAVLDASVIEQFGLISASVGMIMFGLVFVPILPMGAFTATCCGGFAVAFMTQWYLIQRWRAGLRKLAQNGSSVAR